MKGSATNSKRARSAWPSGLRIVTSAATCALVAGACSDRPPDASVEVPAIQLVALPPIDGEGIPGQAGFGRIADLEVHEDATVFVLDELNHVIHAFDGGGEHLGTFGRRGSGPGELATPLAMLWGPDGNLWVVDPANARYTVFDTDGGFAAAFRHVGSNPVFDVWAVGSSRAGLISLVTSGPDLVAQEFWLVECEVVEGTVRELRSFELTGIERPSGFVLQGDGAVMVLPVPFSSYPVFQIGAQGELWYANTREPWVHQWQLPAGDVLRFGRAFDAPGVTQADLDQVLEGADVENLRSAAGQRAVAEFIRSIPDTRPHLEGFFLDDEERVWIIRAGRASDETRVIDVYDRTGTFVASVRAALEPEPRPRVRSGLLVGVIRDALGVESIVRYRIQ